MLEIYDKDKRRDDPKNKAIVKKRMARHDRRKGIRMGDYVILKNPKSMSRVTHDWGDSVQTGGDKDGSFYLGDSGISYSGSLDPSISKKKFKKTNMKKKGLIWIFDKDFAGAGRGVEYYATFRVFKEI